MEELSTRQKTLLRVGLLVAILITLWMFGAVRLVGPVAYAPVAHSGCTPGGYAGLRERVRDCRNHHSHRPPRDREQGYAVVARHREHGHRVWRGCRSDRIEESKATRSEPSSLEGIDEPRSSQGLELTRFASSRC